MDQNQMKTISVIITAGGIGKRMNAPLPKQFLPVRGKPILMRTLEQFYHYNPKMQLLLTLPEDWMSYWEKLCMEYDFHVPHRVVSGGEERYHSIQNALAHCHGDFIAVHDGVRPLVSGDTLDRCFTALRTCDAVVPVVQVGESLRKMEGDASVSVPRADYRIVQTPQCFRGRVLRSAYERPYHAAITDDASLVEETGVQVHMVEGNIENIKITSQADLKFAELYLS